MTDKKEMQWYWDLYDTPEWKRRSVKIRARDDTTCQICADPGTQVHHIQYLTNHPASAAELDLITLCDCCHTATKEWLSAACCEIKQKIEQWRKAKLISEYHLIEFKRWDQLTRTSHNNWPHITEEEDTHTED